ARPSLVARSASVICPPPPTPTLFPYTTLFRSCAWARLRSHPGAAAMTASTPLHLSAEAPLRTIEAALLGALFLGVVAMLSLPARSEEHTSELQSRENLVCRLLLEKKKHSRVVH